jgi:hypothetical protein
LGSSAAALSVSSISAIDAFNAAVGASSSKIGAFSSIGMTSLAQGAFAASLAGRPECG